MVIVVRKAKTSATIGETHGEVNQPYPEQISIEGL
jgi:hypothetical protein